jgi:hypothetical protein
MGDTVVIRTGSEADLSSWLLRVQTSQLADHLARSHLLRLCADRRPDGSTGSIRSRRSRHRHSDPQPIFMSFRGLQAQG